MKNFRALTLGLWGMLSLSACAWPEDFGGTNVPEKSFYYPVDIVASPAGAQGSRYAYVLNSNFDWFYNSGWISVIDVDVLARAIKNKTSARD